MDMIQLAISNDNQNDDENLTFKIHRNTDKKSKTHYIWRSRLNKVSAETTGEESEKINKLYRAVGLTPLNVSFERGCYAVQLDKKQALPWIVNRFQETIGTCEKGGVGSVDVLCHINIPSLVNRDSSSIDLLRQLILAQHLIRLLCYGTSVCPSLCGCDSSIEDVINKVLCSALPDYVNNDSDLVATLATASSVSSVSDNEWMVKFTDPPTIHGNTLHQWRLVRDSLIFRQINLISASLSNRKTIIYHVISTSYSYQHQVVLSILGLLYTTQHQIIHQTIEVGVVKLSPPEAGVADYLESRKSYLINSSKEKYGEINLQEEGFWSSRIDDLTLASIKFELLSRSPQQTVSIATAEGGSCDIKVGSFVMYNCSRLATLFANFHKQVFKGVYPALYAFEDTDFSLLKTEDEWLLAFHYVNVYPVIISDLVTSIQKESVTAYSQLSQVVKFLHNLCRDFSTYYSRTHILGESRPHLMPVMMARLWLMQLVHKVLLSGLRLLDITPYDSM